MSMLPSAFRLAKREAEKSSFNPQMGAVLIVGKRLITGHNREKTHPKYANPEKHERRSLHAELDCLKRSPIFKAGTGGSSEIYVYRELDGLPAMARPCNHCMKFIREAGIEKVYYTIPHEPFWEMEEV